jgi:hypothetical protein
MWQPASACHRLKLHPQTIFCLDAPKSGPTFVYAISMRFLATMLLVLVPLCAQDAPPPKKGGGGAPKNLKVLTPEELHSGVMGKYVAALGVGQSGS